MDKDKAERLIARGRNRIARNEGEKLFDSLLLPGMYPCPNYNPGFDYLFKTATGDYERVQVKHRSKPNENSYDPDHCSFRFVWPHIGNPARFDRLILIGGSEFGQPYNSDIWLLSSSVVPAFLNETNGGSIVYTINRLNRHNWKSENFPRYQISAEELRARCIKGNLDSTLQEAAQA